jgi:hypothetical protein
VQPVLQWKLSIKYSECMFIASGIQQAIRMGRIILSSLVCPALQYFFPHYLINGRIFEKKKVIEHKICVLISSTTFA